MASSLKNLIKRKRDVGRTRHILKLDYTCIASGDCFILSSHHARRLANRDFQ